MLDGNKLSVVVFNVPRTSSRYESSEKGVRQSPGGPFHLAGDRTKRAVRVLRKTKIAQAGGRLVCEALQQRRCESGFPDPGLAAQESSLTLRRSGLCPGPVPKQQFEFLLPPRKGSRAADAQRLKTALN